ncbi:50S ribosomal protein L11 methyltransferase [Crocinitomix catalasitica]|uniref:50S ribosomal protein L11 methyltransferase n=1 Tax=Crocinitomix catalasitica TaxID=184607 RepID=UPI000485678D|nr:50S ribosomal protein L11 methyltransferase [Crocinitomix catalasitica]
MNYIELNITLTTQDPWADIFVADLAEVGFESFVETKSGLQSYIQEKQFDEAMLLPYKNHEAVEKVEFKLIEDENWNATWEAGFEPVIIEDRLAIVAPFHKGEFDQKMIVTIQPQMSFGTGHHQTTWLASKRLFDLDVKDLAVLDMGTGTGILAIVAEKLGAKSVFAPDIDEWAYKNAQDNVAMNDCTKIELALGGDELLVGKKFDLIIANINKNILLAHMHTYASVLNTGGLLLLSGFFTTDESDLTAEASKHDLVFDRIDNKDEWALMQFKKK